MKILVPVKRVVDYNVKVRVKSDGTSVDIANAKMSMTASTRSPSKTAVRLRETEVIAVSCGGVRAKRPVGREQLAFPVGQPRPHSSRA